MPRHCPEMKNPCKISFRSLYPTQSSLRTEQKSPQAHAQHPASHERRSLSSDIIFPWLLTTVRHRDPSLQPTRSPGPRQIPAQGGATIQTQRNATRPQSRAHRLNHAPTLAAPGTRFLNLLGAPKTMFHAARFAGSRQVGLSAAHGRFATKAAPRGEFGRPCIKVGGPWCVGARRVKSTVGEFESCCCCCPIGLETSCCGSGGAVGV